MNALPVVSPAAGGSEHGGGLSDADLDFIRDLVRRRTAIVLDPGKRYLVENRLAPLVRGGRFPSIAALVGALRRPSSGLSDQVVDALTTNETSFFRDGRPFDALRDHLLPALVAARAGTRALTIWSAACSSGQEPYSVAMLLLEHFPQLRHWNVRIIASDISPTMLGQAASGTYSPLEVGRGLPPPLLAKYFTRQGRGFEISSLVRGMIEFRSVNLAEPWPFIPVIDVLLLRNVLIYFDQVTKQQTLAQVRQVLRPDGYLILGGTETTLGVDAAFRREQVGAGVVYRPGGAAAGS